MTKRDPFSFETPDLIIDLWKRTHTHPKGLFLLFFYFLKFQNLSRSLSSLTKKKVEYLKEMASALTFNENDGFIDGILRGYYSGILNSTQYLNFSQCETLEGKEYQTVILHVD